MNLNNASGLISCAIRDPGYARFACRRRCVTSNEIEICSKHNRTVRKYLRKCLNMLGIEDRTSFFERISCGRCDMERYAQDLETKEERDSLMHFPVNRDRDPAWIRKADIVGGNRASGRWYSIRRVQATVEVCNGGSYFAT